MENIFETLYQHYEKSLEQVEYVDYRQESVNEVDKEDDLQEASE